MTDQAKHISRTDSLAAILVVLACAASAGIHAGLTPEHLGELPLLGVSFIAATVLLAATGVAVAFRPRAQAPAIVAALLFGLLTLAYTASRTTGLPVLEPDPETVDAIGMVTVTVQLAGLGAALWLVLLPERTVPAAAGGDRGRPDRRSSLRTGSVLLAGAVTVLLSAAFALGSTGNHDHTGGSHEEGHNHKHAMAAVVHGE